MSTFPVVGKLAPDAASDLLGTGYKRFESPTGIQGLAKANTGRYISRLDLLAVVASKPGTGQFRRFVAECQAMYNTVCVWESWNPILGRALAKYGFYKALECDGDTYEPVSGWRWDKRSAQGARTWVTTTEASPSSRRRSRR